MKFDEQQNLEDRLPVQVQACIALLIQAGQDKAAEALRTQWFDPNHQEAVG